jgi:transcriptional regulator GlxA family with amidase domain
VITAAGVSSGIDMALVLLDRMYGAEVAQMIQLAIEYDPQPPFDAGSPAKAPAALVELVQQQIGAGPALPATTTGGSR